MFTFLSSLLPVCHSLAPIISLCDSHQVRSLLRYILKGFGKFWYLKHRLHFLLTILLPSVVSTQLVAPLSESCLLGWFSVLQATRTSTFTGMRCLEKAEGHRGTRGIPWQKSKCCVASVPRPPVSLYIFFCLEVMYAASMALSATSKLKASIYLTSSPDFSLLLGQQLSWDLCWVLTYARPNLPAPCHGRFCCTDILPCILLAKSAFFLSHCLIFFFSSCWL